MAMDRREYLFVYDAVLDEPRHARSVAALEAAFASLELRGRTVRASEWRSPHDAVKAASKDGAAAIVVVGSDATFSYISDAVLGSRVPIGYIPMLAPSALAEALSIPVGAEAAKVLAARHLDRVGAIGVDGKKVVLGSIRIEGSGVRVVSGDGWAARLCLPGSLEIRGQSRVAPGQMPRLELVLAPRGEPASRWRAAPAIEPARFFTGQAAVDNIPSDAAVWMDGRLVGCRSFRVEALPDALTFITGRPKPPAR